MTHMEPSALATYNSLVDPNLRCYFSNERIRSHLKHVGLISRKGEILSDNEYRAKLVRREHKKHVQQILAENIVHRAIDMERKRQATMRRQFEIDSKVEFVKQMKASRERRGYSSTAVSTKDDIGLLSMNSSWSQLKSPSQLQQMKFLNNPTNESNRISRVQSAQIQHHRSMKSASRSPSRYQLNRAKSSHIHRASSAKYSSSLNRKSFEKSLQKSNCKIKMIYYGRHNKLDNDQSRFDSKDEILVMQQHCGGENLTVFKEKLNPGDEFTFESHRHSDYPLGLSFYIQGLIDSRISTCCEYKHRYGVRLGGERGHFAIVSVQGSRPCLKCRFQKQTHMREGNQSGKGSNSSDIDDQEPIFISMKPTLDESGNQQVPVKIPVRHFSNQNYSEDFESSQKNQTHDSASSSIRKSQLSEKKKDTSTLSSKDKIQINEISSEKINDNSSSHDTATSSTTMQSGGNLSKKTWQITFHTSNIPMGSLQLPSNSSIDGKLRFSFLSKSSTDETETYSIDLQDFPQCFKSGRQDSFPAKLKNIGSPKKIRLTLDIKSPYKTDLKWHLDHIEVIDPETQIHSRFIYQKWIRPNETYLIELLDTPLQSPVRKTSSSSTHYSQESSNSFNRRRIHQRQQLNQQTSKRPLRHSSSISSISSNSDRIKRKNSQIKSITNQTDTNSTENLRRISYELRLVTSNQDDGEFNALSDSRIFIRLNDQQEEILFNPTTRMCPSFQPGECQSFSIHFRLKSGEKPIEFILGYKNSDITATTWQIEKIILKNNETNEETTFTCDGPLVRNDFDFIAKKKFYQQIKTDQTSKSSIPITKNRRQVFENNHEGHSTKSNRSPSLTSTTSSNKPDQRIRSPSLSHNTNEFSKDVQKHEVEHSESPMQLRPKTRRGREEVTEKRNEEYQEFSKSNLKRDMWKAESEQDNDDDDDDNHDDDHHNKANKLQLFKLNRDESEKQSSSRTMANQCEEKVGEKSSDNNNSF